MAGHTRRQAAVPLTTQDMGTETTGVSRPRYSLSAADVALEAEALPAGLLGLIRESRQVNRLGVLQVSPHVPNTRPVRQPGVSRGFGKSDLVTRVRAAGDIAHVIAGPPEGKPSEPSARCRPRVAAARRQRVASIS